MSSAEQGWGNPRPYDSKSKFHFYAKDGRSLCGRYGRFLGLPEVDDAKDEHSLNCAGCKKRIEKYRQKEAQNASA